LPTEKSEADRQEERQRRENEIGLTNATWWLTRFTLLLAFVGIAQLALFWVQLGIIRKSLIDAKHAADAATKGAKAAELNAQALIDAESAQMYFVQDSSNIDKLYQLGGMYDNSPTMADSPSAAPIITYRLRNYGKSPAIIQAIIHGMSLEGRKRDGEQRNYRIGQEAMEIIGVGEQGEIITCKFDKTPFTFGDVRSIVTNDLFLYFYGRAEFIDHFGRKQTLEWEHIADSSKWNLIGHKNTRENAKSE
jgi:hypothetical protein